MTEYRRERGVALPADQVFDYLSDVGNLPSYMSSMTEAKLTGDREVRVKALVDGKEEEGEAWLERDSANRSMRWGSEGPNDYHGELRVEEDGDSRSTMIVTLSTVRESGGDIEAGLEETLAAAQRQLEGG